MRKFFIYLHSGNPISVQYGQLLHDEVGSYSIIQLLSYSIIQLAKCKLSNFINLITFKRINLQTPKIKRRKPKILTKTE